MFGDALAVAELQEFANEERKRDSMVLGLDSLRSLKQIFIQRTFAPSLTSSINAINESKDRKYYQIIDSSGIPLFKAMEDSPNCDCCSDLREFVLSIYNENTETEILKLRRPFRGDCCWCPWCMQYLEVLASHEQALIGTITQEWSVCRPRFAIKLPTGEIMFRMYGPCCTMRCCVRDLNFEVFSYTAHRMGKVAASISRQWSGVLRDTYEETDFFGVGFTQDLEARMKALIISACFLVNALYYQT